MPARKAGFKTGYVTFEEIVGCEDLWGKPDLTEDGLAKLAKSIVDSSS
jgi:2-haloacid dehalogenase